MELYASGGPTTPLNEFGAFRPPKTVTKNSPASSKLELGGLKILPEVI